MPSDLVRPALSSALYSGRLALIDCFWLYRLKFEALQCDIRRFAIGLCMIGHLADMIGHLADWPILAILCSLPLDKNSGRASKLTNSKVEAVEKVDF